jgi:glycosyltransferase involved in cell wall biosynthesis
LGIGDQAVVLAYFGFLNESKGGEDLIMILDAVIRQGLDAYLLMIGGDVGDSDPNNAAYAQRVRQLIAERDLSSRIIFTGYVESAAVSANLLAADMAVMPYRDGVSFRRTTLIAALRHGLPVISTYPAVDLPQIRDGENMLLAPSADVDSLSQAVIRVTSDSELRERLSSGARSLGQAFDWSRIAAETVRVYEAD